MSGATPAQPDIGARVPVPERHLLFIDNARTGAASGEWLDVRDPYTGDVWAQVPNGSAEDSSRAVQAALRAFREGEWSKFVAQDRARLLRRLGDLFEEKADLLTEIQIRENGKPVRETSVQMTRLGNFYRYYAGLAETHSGRLNPPHLSNLLNYTLRQPMGVVATITPWNSPISLLTWKIGPALAAGNTIVVKPSEITPVSTLVLADFFVEAGFPPGVFNVVTGLGPRAGSALVEHPDVAKITFTGSTATGRAIGASAGASMKRVSLELGGKSPNIVFADADLDRALDGITTGIFGSSGQSCTAGSRILIEDSVYDRMLDGLERRARALKLGDPRDPETEMGPVASVEQLNKVLRYCELAIEEGARLVTGGARASGVGLDHGLFVEPTVFADVASGMRHAQEEIFGPVASVIRFHGESEAIELANDTEYGLGAGIWTQNLGKAHRVAEAVKAGSIWVNSYRKQSYSSPFGGFNQSGIGRENGADALNEFTEEKSVWVDLTPSAGDEPG